MTYGEKDYKNYLEKVREFRELGWVQNHLHLLRKPNFWTILEYGRGGQERSAHETRMSRMFRWLLDANETHGLGNIFAHKLLEFNNEYQQNEHQHYAHHPGKNEAIQTIAEQTTSDGKRLDLLFEDLTQKVIIAIEVKQYAKEGEYDGVSQLDWYEKYINERIKDTNIRPYYIYLTPMGEESSKSNWTPISYDRFIDFIDEVYDKYMTDSTVMYIEDTKKIISDFKDDLQRTIDFESSKDHRNDINEMLSPKEKKLTQLLANEIQNETDTEHLNALKELNADNQLELKDLILILGESIYAQNRTTNVGVQMLTRKIYNFFSEGENLHTNPDEIKEYKQNQKFEHFKQSVIEKYDLPYEKIAITRDKGQGIFIYHKDHPYRVYLSGDAHGNFPNDGIQLLPYGDNEKKAKKFPTINNEKFKVDYNLMLENKIKTRDGNEITIDQLIEDYIIVELKRLTNLMTE